MKKIPKLHFKPQTSYLCPVSLDTILWDSLISLYNILLSLDPLVKTFEFQANAPTLEEWPDKTLSFFNFTASHICTSPVLVPIDKCGPREDQFTLVTASDIPRSHTSKKLKKYYILMVKYS